MYYLHLLRWNIFLFFLGLSILNFLSSNGVLLGLEPCWSVFLIFFAKTFRFFLLLLLPIALLGSEYYWVLFAEVLQYFFFVQTLLGFYSTRAFVVLGTLLGSYLMESCQNFSLLTPYWVFNQLELVGFLLNKSLVRLRTLLGAFEESSL